MKALRLKEILCVLLTVAFIVLVTRHEPPSSVSAKDMAAALCRVTDVSALDECKNADFRREIQLNPNDYDGVVFYSSPNIMEVRELLVVRLADESQGEALTECLRSRVEAKRKLFHAYAPEQEALLDGYVLENTRGFVLFAVSENPEAVRQTFKETL